MLFRVIGYLFFIILYVFLALKLVSIKPMWFKEVWKKTLTYCIAFVCFIVSCHIFDYILNLLGL